MKRIEKIRLHENAVVLNEQEMKHISGGSTWWCHINGTWDTNSYVSEDVCNKYCSPEGGTCSEHN